MTRHTGLSRGTARTLLTGTTAIAALALLAGCASSPAPSDPAATAPATNSAAPTASPSTPADDAAATADNGPLLAAVALAIAEVPGSALTSIELEDNGNEWEVDVANTDGVEFRVEVTADGSRVLTGPTEDDDDDEDRAKHRDRLAQATLDLPAVVAAIAAEAGDRRITELSLDSRRDGRVVWEAELEGDSARDEVDIDAATAEVLRSTLSR